MALAPEGWYTAEELWVDYEAYELLTDDGGPPTTATEFAIMLTLAINAGGYKVRKVDGVVQYQISQDASERVLKALGL